MQLPQLELSAMNLLQLREDRASKYIGRLHLAIHNFLDSLAMVYLIRVAEEVVMVVHLEVEMRFLAPLA